MGVRLKRAGFVVLALGAILLPFRKPGTPSERRIDDARELRLAKLSQERRDARHRWTALQERDSALELSVSRDPMLHLQGFPANLDRADVESTVRKQWSAIANPDSTVLTAVLVYNITQSTNEATWGSYWGNLITTRGGRTACVTIVPGEVHQQRLLVGRDLIETVSAPCTLLATFGNPGSGMQAWLSATRYTSARSNTWLTGTPMLYEGGRAPWGWLFPVLSYAPQQMPALLKWLGNFEVAEGLAPPYYYGAPGIRCMIGHVRSCVESVLHSGIVLARDPGIPPDLTVSSVYLRPDTVTLATPRPPEGSFISDLIRRKGRDKFRVFWKSELPLEQAFQSAFGESLGAWTAQWAKRKWETSFEARIRHSTIVLGTNLSASWPLLVMGWTGLVLAAVAWIAQRKQVT